MSYDAMGAAAINATILAIILGGASAYGLIHFQAVHQMVTDLLDHATKVASLTWHSFHSGGPNDDDLRNMSPTELVGDINKTVWRQIGARDDDPAAAGSRVLAAISLLCSTYPFSEGSARKAIQTEPPLEPTRPLDLSTEGAVQSRAAAD